MELPKPLLVALGGVAGASARWAVFEVVSGLWALTVVNVAGAFLLGTLAHGVLRGSAGRMLLLAVGFCGAFTTFSTLAAEIATRLDAGHPLDAVGVATSSLLLGLLAVALGASTRRWAQRS